MSAIEQRTATGAEGAGTSWSTTPNLGPLLADKVERLRQILQGLSPDGVAVAFSGGVDSTFLLAIAHETLGDRALGVTESSAFSPSADMAEAAVFCDERGIRRIVFEADVLADDTIASNPADRCYHCKHVIFSRVIEIARENGCSVVVDGTNVDDEGDYRPGMRALGEMGVVSPLRMAGMTKDDIRRASKAMGLPTWNKPSAACLASRVAYGERITAQKLARIDAAEELLHAAGFVQCRVRVHGGEGDLARIEVPADQIARLASGGLRTRLAADFKALGFKYVTLDLVGYRMGSMNEALA